MADTKPTIRLDQLKAKDLAMWGLHFDGKAPWLGTAPPEEAGAYERPIEFLWWRRPTIRDLDWNGCPSD